MAISQLALPLTYLERKCVASHASVMLMAMDSIPCAALRMMLGALAGQGTGLGPLQAHRELLRRRVSVLQKLDIRDVRAQTSNKRVSTACRWRRTAPSRRTRRRRCAATAAVRSSASQTVVELEAALLAIQTFRAATPQRSDTPLLLYEGGSATVLRAEVLAQLSYGAAPPPVPAFTPCRRGRARVQARAVRRCSC